MTVTDEHVHQDIWINGVPLNFIDENGSRWVVTNVDGWWGAPSAEIPQDFRPYNEDGNYWASGRYSARLIQIQGVVMQASPNEHTTVDRIIEARNTLSDAVILVRGTGVLTFREKDATKVSEVQVYGRPIFQINTQGNVLNFDLQFLAADPRKYSETIYSNNSFMNVTSFGSAGRRYDIDSPPDLVREYNRRYIEEETSPTDDYITIQNNGNYNTFGTIRISGPVQNPRITNQTEDKYLQVNMTLGRDDYLDIDLGTRTIILNGSESRLARLDFSSQWFVYPPGTTRLLYTGTPTETPQLGWDAATNRVTNPTMVTVDSLQDIVENVMPNPSFHLDGTPWETSHKNYSPYGDIYPGDQMLPPATNATVSVAPWGDSSETYAWKVKPSGSDNNSYIDITPETTFLPGQTYTAMADGHYNYPPLGDLHQYAGRLVVRYPSGSETVILTSDDPTIDEPYRARVVFTIPEDTPVYSWTGTPDASPSTETIEGVLTRTNLLSQPEPVVGTSGWNSNAAYPVVIEPTSGREGRAAAVTTRTTVSLSTAMASLATVGSSSNVNRVPVEPGRAYTFSVYVKTERADYRTRMIVRWYTSGGATITDSDTALVPVSPGAGEWHRAVTTVVAPAAAATALLMAVTIYTTSGNAVEGEQVWFSDAMMEAEPVDTTYEWTGTPDASPSTETIDGVLTRTNLMLRPEPTSGGGWTSGSTSYGTVTHLPGGGRGGRDAAQFQRAAGTTGPNIIASPFQYGMIGLSAASGPAVEPGKTYTMSLYVKVNRPDHNWKAYLQIGWMDSDGSQMGSYLLGPTFTHDPDAEGWTRVSFTATAPTGAAYLRTFGGITTLTGNAVEGELSWLCDAQLEEVQNPTGTLYDWTGTPHASTSTETIDGVLTRTNFAINPGPALPTTGGAPVVGWVGLTRQGSAAVAESNTVYTANIAADSGEQWAASVVLTALNTPTTVRVDLRETASGAFGAQPYIATVMSVDLVPGVPQTVALGGTISTSPSTDGLRLALSGSGVSTNVAVGNTLITRGTTTPGTYFDGGTQDVPDQVEPTEFFYGDTFDTTTNLQGVTEFFYGDSGVGDVSVRLYNGSALQPQPEDPDVQLEELLPLENAIYWDHIDITDGDNQTEPLYVREGFADTEVGITRIMVDTGPNLLPVPVPMPDTGWHTADTLPYDITVVSEPSESRNGEGSHIQIVREEEMPSTTIASVLNIGGFNSWSEGIAQVTPGQQYTFSVYAKCDVPGWRWEIEHYNLDEDMESTGGPVDGVITTASVDSEGWARLSKTITAPAGTFYMSFNVRITTTSGNAPTGAVTLMQDAMLNTGATASPFTTKRLLVEQNRVPVGWEMLDGSSGLSIELLGEFLNTAMAVEYGSDTTVQTVSGYVPTPTSDESYITIGADLSSTKPAVVTPVLVVEEDGQVTYISGTSTTLSSPSTVRVQSQILKPESDLPVDYRIGFRIASLESSDEAITMVEEPGEVPADGTTTSLVVDDPRSVLYITKLVVVEGYYEKGYFDGWYQPAGVEDTVWSGADITSSSIARGYAVAGYTASPDAVQYRTSTWKKHGTTSMALRKKPEVLFTEGTWAEVDVAIPSGAGTYTVIAHVSPEVGDYLTDPTSRTITVVNQTTGEVISSAQAAPGVDSRLRVEFTKEGLEDISIRLVSNATDDSIVYWDGIMVVTGSYNDRYFDGTFSEASWTGTAHQSTSTQVFKESIPTPSVYTRHQHAWIS